MSGRIVAGTIVLGLVVAMVVATGEDKQSSGALAKVDCNVNEVSVVCVTDTNSNGSCSVRDKGGSKGAGLDLTHEESNQKACTGAGVEYTGCLPSTLNRVKVLQGNNNDCRVQKAAE
jgi:hypothetical protein